MSAPFNLRCLWMAYRARAVISLRFRRWRIHQCLCELHKLRGGCLPQEVISRLIDDLSAELRDLDALQPKEKCTEFRFETEISRKPNVADGKSF